MKAPAATVLALCVLAACGSQTHSGGATQASQTNGSGGTGAATTKAAFTVKADAICAKAEATQAPVKARFEASTTPAEGLTELKTLIADERRAVAQLRLLRKPSHDASQLGEWLTALEQKLTRESTLTHAIEANDVKAEESDEHEIEADYLREHGLAEEYGLSCGKKPK